MRADTRRVFLQSMGTIPLFAAPLAGASTYSWSEVDRMLESGNFKGKLSKDDLPTPVLLLDLDAFESNVRKMAAHARTAKRALRPHGKTHKCPEIAKRIIQAGAVGACTAKLSEAEVFAAEGVKGLLITTQVVGKHKIERAMKLAKGHPDTMFSVDSPEIVRQFDEAARAAGIKARLAVDLNVSGRTGIEPGEPGAGLAALIDSLPGVEFAGIQAYSGQASHTRGFEQRTKVSQEAMGRAIETRRLIEKKGIACNLLTGGSTGTYNIDTSIDGITEIQPGSFMFMDVDYAKIGGADGSEQYRDFQFALFVRATVVSVPEAGTATLDAGFKAVATDRSFGPDVRSPDGATYRFAGDEHGKLTLLAGAPALKVGDRAELIVPHCDPNVNLYDRIYGVRGDQVETVWRISARGMSQ